MNVDARLALITGISGQDGWFLSRRLLALGQRVIGTSHRPDSPSTLEIDGRTIRIVPIDLGDMRSIDDVIRVHRPDDVYNLAARASSAQLFDDPLATADINGVAVARWLEAIRQHSPGTRFCQASSGEVFAGATASPQDEQTPRRPCNAYGAAKAFADHLVAAYRATHGLFACSAILYPHESPRRPPHFLVRKVAQAAARIAAGAQHTLALGDLSAVRDWGYAADYVEAMRLMLAAPRASDYVIASGVAHTVGEVCEVAFAHVGLDWRHHVVVDDQLKRSPDAVRRVGNPARARAELGWRSTLDFAQLIGHLVDADRLPGRETLA
jgi:GDPmannose 4,6-dehydratase